RFFFPQYSKEKSWHLDRSKETDPSPSFCIDGNPGQLVTNGMSYTRPVYINSKKTVAEGRRISATKACENPTCIEIGDCCSYLKIPFAIELDKAYPRDFMQRGRVRVQLKREDGSLWNSEIDSKLIPKHHGRTKKQEPVNTSTAAGPSKSGKGGRKKK
ncbi:Signal recognition particle 19 kDa, partial [Musa troglodytarum]